MPCRVLRAMIRFENVTKVYDQKARPALDSVNLEIDRGEFAFLVGASGSGKSTFLRLVLKEDRASSGAVYVAGQNVARISSWRVPRLRRGIGVVFQDFRLLADEPTGNLDPTTSMGIMGVLDKINQNGTTVVMATHDDDIVNEMRKRVVELKNGVVIRDEAKALYTSMIPVVGQSRRLRDASGRDEQPQVIPPRAGSRAEA